MGVIKRGLLGGFSGRVGNIVGSSWKGIAVMKSLPLSVANPRTAGQVGQRTAFSACVVVAGILLAEIIKPFWDRFAQKMSGYNDFMSKNVTNFSSSGVLDYPNFVISVGALLGLPDLVVTADNSDNEITIAFSDNSGTGNALATDEVSIVVYNSTQDYWDQYPAEFSRDNGNAGIAESVMTTGDVLKVYVAVRRADGTLVSGTQFASVVVAA